MFAVCWWTLDLVTANLSTLKCGQQLYVDSNTRRCAKVCMDRLFVVYAQRVGVYNSIHDVSYPVTNKTV